MSLPPLDDGGAGDDEPEPRVGPPPDPMDRIWRHPSELPRLRERPPGVPVPARSGSPRLRGVLVPLGVGALGAILTVAVLAAAGAFDRHSVAGDAGPSAPNGAIGTIASLATKVAPSIVAVRVSTAGGIRNGSGVCVRHAGQILTSERLVTGALRVDVVTADGVEHPARVIGRDVDSDLALVSIDNGLQAADLETAGALKLGDAVYAVGFSPSPSKAPWISAGTVSSLAGRVTDGPKGPTMAGLIETNALMENAVAGGALVDGTGRVAGILMTPVSGRDPTIAVPIAFASEVADALRTGGHVDHGWIGLNGHRAPNGLVVTAVARGGPSEQAGIKVGDVITDADSQLIGSTSDLMATVRAHWPGERIPITLLRARDPLDVSVRLAQMPAGAPAAPGATTTTVPTNPVQALTPTSS